MTYIRDTIFILYALFIVSFFVQSYLSYLQNKELQKNVLKMNRIYSKDCHISVGKKKARIFRKGYVVILAVNSTREIVNAEVLAGMTVFARVKQETEIIGKSIDDWRNVEKKKMTYKDHAIVDAIDKLIVA